MADVLAKNIVFASCDEKYFLEHGEAFIRSACEHGETPRVHCQHHTPETHSLAQRLESQFPTSRVIFLNYEDKYKDAHDKRSVYAIGRFIYGKNLLHNNILFLDIDSFFRKPVAWEDFRKMDYALFFRESLPGTVGWEKIGTKVAAGAVYVSHRSRLLSKTMEFINEYPNLPWFVDQVALWKAHEALQFDEHYCQMPAKYIDWEFKEDSVIWTGKGNRKNSEKYLYEKQRILQA